MTTGVRRWWLFLGCLIAWQWATSAAHDKYFPTPAVILRQAGHLWLSGPGSRLLLSNQVFADILPSLGRVLLGWAVAAVLGVAIGLVVGRSPVLDDYCRGVFAFARAVPPAVLVPVFLVVLRVGSGMAVTTIVFGAVWPILLDTADGARSIDPLTTDVVRLFRTPWYQRIVRVIVPAAGPKIFAGLRVGLSIAFILMIVAEMLGGTSGIGHQLAADADLPSRWAWIVLVGVLAYLVTGALALVEHRVLRWHRAVPESAEQPSVLT
ncbi:MAG TPA: ABC transporter permease subunit [Pseudonocardiaceae bacterium]|jgi:ABC-type nitrate/sulfonate/bicarbonate transport system permease component|nr:ABC transporter permease subunit [Pseudonocardiaceae bacterium]